MTSLKCSSSERGSWISCFTYSLGGGTEGSPDLKIVTDIAGLAVLGGQLKVVLLALLSLRVDINILVVIPADGLTLIGVESSLLGLYQFIETGLSLSHSVLVAL